MICDKNSLESILASASMSTKGCPTLAISSTS